jgi:hypothetical protein
VSALREYVRTRPGAMATAAGVILLVQLVVRAWSGYRGFFYIDDFAFTGRAARYGFSAKLLFTDYNSHVMPGSFIWVWATTTLWPLLFGAVMTVALLLQLLLGVVVYRLLVQLFGHRLGVLVVFAVFVLTPITLPAFLWWAAALNQLPQQLAMATALLWHVRYLRTGRVRWGIAGGVAIGLGLLFSEKTLLAVPLIVAFTVFYAAPGRWLSRLKAAWRDHWAVWLCYLVLTVPYAVYYVVAVPAPAHRQSTGGDVATVAGSALSHALAPGLLGGPWTWHPIGFAGAVAGPGRIATWISCIAGVVLIVGTIVWWRRAAFAWVLVFGYIALDVALVASSRATIVGPSVGDEYRYFTDVGMVAALGLGLAVMPITGTFARGSVQPLEARESVRAATRRALADQFGWSGARTAGRAVVVVALVLGYIASSTVSLVRYDRFWHPNPARPYLTTARAELETAPSSLVLFDDTVPQEVAWGLLYPYNRYSLFFAPLENAPKTLKPGESSDQLAVFDQTGHLRLVGILGVHGVPGPRPQCGWRVGARPVTVDLQGPTGAGPDVLRIGYIANGDGVLEVSAGATEQEVPMHRGLHAVFLLVHGATDIVTLRVKSGGSALCTDEVAVGLPVGVPGSRP